MGKRVIIRNKTEKSATDSETACLSQGKIENAERALLKGHLF